MLRLYSNGLNPTSLDDIIKTEFSYLLTSRIEPVVSGCAGLCKTSSLYALDLRRCCKQMSVDRAGGSTLCFYEIVQEVLSHCRDLRADRS